MTDTEAAKLVTVAVSACPTQGGKMAREQIRDMAMAWAMLLEDIDYADGAAALKRWLATSHWLPAPSQLRAIVAESRHGRRRSGVDAWGDVLAAVHRDGRNRVPVFDDPIVARVVDRMGWVRLCDSEDATADRARFASAYDRLAAEAAEDATVATLPGVARPALPERTGAHHLVAAVTRALPAPESNDV